MDYGNLQSFIEQLPVGKVIGQVDSALRTGSRLVLTAPPGSGKSTLLPLTIARTLDDGKVVLLEPRRAAARQIAVRMAHMIGESPGETVGYRMRFETKVSAATRVEVVTEGIMERMLIDDPTLEGVAAVIFDEFHERSLTADLSLALTLEAQNMLRPDLKLVLMSATIDSRKLCDALGAPLIETSGKIHDVEIRYGDDIDPRDCVPAVSSAVLKAYREQPGNILAFLPGQGEILKCHRMLADALPGAEVVPLYGMLSQSEQSRAIEYNPQGKRKIVLATPVAETSLTIEGVRTVVDSGLYRAVKYNPATGLGQLVTERISLDMARQRAGRAGRLSEGVCYRLWTKGTEHRMKENRTPEITEADLSSMLLAVAAWGGARIEDLPWVTPPAAGHVEEARRLLALLGAIDAGGCITRHGRAMAALPCHPRIANMLVTASDERLKALACDIAALLEERDPDNDENNADINRRIDRLRGTARRGYDRVRMVAQQYRQMVRCKADYSPVDPYDAGMLIASAYPERVAVQLDNGSYRLASGQNVNLDSHDDLNAAEYLAVASLGRRIYLCSPIRKDALVKMASMRRRVIWDSREGRVIARKELKIGVLLIDSQPLDNVDRGEIDRAICAAAPKEGLSMFDFNENVAKLQQRIATVAAWHPELTFPDVTIPGLLAAAESWLPMYAGKAVSAQEFKKIDICQVISGLVGYENMAELDRIAPDHLRLPGGRTVKIEYRQGCESPVVSARLQDCLGMCDTPMLDGGRRPVLMELLSPGFKPVQLTSDLRGFWTNTYFEVRKELRRRYPNHRWPDNPLDYTPV